MTLYYQPSGRFTATGIVLFVVLGLVAAVPLAFVYVYAVWYIPFIYVNLFLTLGLGFALGYVLKLLTRVGKLRNPSLAGWLGLVVGLWAWYVQWCLYITLLDGAGEAHSLGSRASYLSTTFSADMFLYALRSPAVVFSALPELAAEGTWSLFGVTISGIFLYLIWLAELAIIVGLSWLLPQSQAAVPYSELADEWTEKRTLPQLTTHFPNAAATKAALEAADWHHLQLRPTETENPHAPFGRLHFYQAPSDPDCCYLSLENVTIELDKKGKPEEKTTDVLAYLRVPPATARELQARFGQQAVNTSLLK